MNKSPLGKRIGQLMRLAHYANQHRLTSRELDQVIDDPGRRAFIRRMALGAAGLALSSNLRPFGSAARAAGAGTPIAQAAMGGDPVVIIGAGGGGMAASAAESSPLETSTPLGSSSSAAPSSSTPATPP
jgi:hypothetical protein